VFIAACRSSSTFLPLSLVLFGFLVLWVCVLFVSMASLVYAASGDVKMYARGGGVEEGMQS
jgi:hypothetical protein